MHSPITSPLRVQAWPARSSSESVTCHIRQGVDRVSSAIRCTGPSVSFDAGRPRGPPRRSDEGVPARSRARSPSRPRYFGDEVGVATETLANSDAVRLSNSTPMKGSSPMTHASWLGSMT